MNELFLYFVTVVPIGIAMLIAAFNYDFNNVKSESKMENYE